MWPRSFAESFLLIAEGFVCFCKKRFSDNGKKDYSAVDFSDVDQGLTE